MGSVDITTGTGSLEDAINANTKALEKTNSALADMIRQAGALVLSDNMRLGSTVAASGTAQGVSAANSYHREGDTNITQNIYSKQTSSGKPAGKPTRPRPANDERRTLCFLRIISRS